MLFYKFKRFIQLNLLICSTLFYTQSLEAGDPKNQDLQLCLMDCWGVDFHTAAFICNQFNQLIDADYQHVIDEFIFKSNQLHIKFPVDKALSPLPSEDGLIQATKHHIVVFESPYVRILAGNAEPGEKEPTHTHAWKSLMVLFEEATYLIEYTNGMIETLELSPGVFELPAGESYACTNLGKVKEKCLRFEIKD